MYSYVFINVEKCQSEPENVCMGKASDENLKRKGKKIL